MNAISVVNLFVYSYVNSTNESKTEMLNQLFCFFSSSRYYANINEIPNRDTGAWPWPHQSVFSLPKLQSVCNPISLFGRSVCNSICLYPCLQSVCNPMCVFSQSLWNHIPVFSQFLCNTIPAFTIVSLCVTLSQPSVSLCVTLSQPSVSLCAVLFQSVGV